MQYPNESFCKKSLGPWIVGLVVTAVMFVFWTVMKREEIISGMESENKEPAKPTPTTQDLNAPRFPNAVQPAAFQSTPYQPVAITKATPNGGMQLVAAVGPNVSDSRFQNSLKGAVNKIIPSVVDIHARTVANAPAPAPVDAQNLEFVPPFGGGIDKFIGNAGFENIGSGIFVDGRGYVLTNYHVTKDANEIVVTIFGNPTRDVRADVVANEPNLDLALIKVRDNGPFPEAQLADSTQTQVGDYVVAVGSPFGIEQTVTSGIISGVRKSVMIEGLRYENLFQTDAPINHGSSGGPLVNLRGEVIGINTAIYAPTGVFNGTGFSIPVNDCRNFLSQTLERNYSVPVIPGTMPGDMPPTNLVPQAPTPVHFGLEVLPVNEVIAKQFGVPMQGVLVNRVMDELPASLAGIKRGDIILSMAGFPIETAEDIRDVVARFHLGDNVNVNILRNGIIDEVFVRLQ